MVDLQGQELARLPGLCLPPLPRGAELTHLCSNGSASLWCKQDWSRFQAAGLEFGAATSLLALPRMSTELTGHLPGSRTRSWRPGGPRGAQRGPASLPACPLAVYISPKGDSSPEGTKRCSQHSGLSAWDSCAVHNYRSSQLMLCLCTAALQRMPILSSALCIFLHVYSVLLSV